MTRDNLKLLDIDEYLRPIHTDRLRDLIAFARKYNLTVDLASSDVCVYLEDRTGKFIGLG